MANLADFVRIVYFIVSNVIGSLQKQYFFLKTYILRKLKQDVIWLYSTNIRMSSLLNSSIKNENNKHFTYRYSIMTEAEGYKESKWGMCLL